MGGEAPGFRFDDVKFHGADADLRPTQLCSSHAVRPSIAMFERKRSSLTSFPTQLELLQDFPGRAM